MQKNESLEAVREREREREPQFSKTRVFLWSSKKNVNRKIEGRNTFIHNGKRQTMKIKILSHSGKF